jgi:hypothetical protein
VSDIVEILRQLHAGLGYPYAAAAADEIERLRKELEYWKHRYAKDHFPPRPEQPGGSA